MLRSILKPLLNFRDRTETPSECKCPVGTPLAGAAAVQLAAVAVRAAGGRGVPRRGGAHAQRDGDVRQPEEARVHDSAQTDLPNLSDGSIS